jgi:hypothetical protein
MQGAIADLAKPTNFGTLAGLVIPGKQGGGARVQDLAGLLPTEAYSRTKGIMEVVDSINQMDFSKMKGSLSDGDRAYLLRNKPDINTPPPEIKKYLEKAITAIQSEQEYARGVRDRLGAAPPPTTPSPTTPRAVSGTTETPASSSGWSVKSVSK